MILLAESHHSIRFSGHQVLGHLNDFYTIASVGGGAVAGGVDFSTRAFIFPGWCVDWVDTEWVDTVLQVLELGIGHD